MYTLPAYIERCKQVDIRSAKYTYIERPKIARIVLYTNALYKAEEIQFNVSVGVFPLKWNPQLKSYEKKVGAICVIVSLHFTYCFYATTEG